MHLQCRNALIPLLLKQGVDPLLRLRAGHRSQVDLVLDADDLGSRPDRIHLEPCDLFGARLLSIAERLQQRVDLLDGLLHLLGIDLEQRQRLALCTLLQ